MNIRRLPPIDSIKLKTIYAFRHQSPLGRFSTLFVGTLLGVGVFTAARPTFDWVGFEKDKKTSVDRGYGPGKPVGVARQRFRLGEIPAKPRKNSANGAAKSSAPLQAPAPSLAAAAVAPAPTGQFGQPFPWPIIPIHMALLPDGRVLSFGTDQTGAQGSQMVYDVWTPNLGNVPEAHNVLPNTTATDIFCAGASLLDGSGNLLITGGDLTKNGQRNYANNKVEIFNPAQNTLTSSQPMNYARWYGTVVTLPNGDKLELGGQNNKDVPAVSGAATPEVRSATLGWRTLPGIAIDRQQWFYPRGFVGPDGKVYLVQEDGTIMRLATDGDTGTMQDTGSRVDAGQYSYPSLMFRDTTGNSYSVLTIRLGRVAQVVDISSSSPIVRSINQPNYDRIWGNATLLADGQILYSGGSGVANELTNVFYQAEIYNPATGTWTLDAAAANPRLYHSAALLLPDGTVLTGGGGAPGPVNELNAEIYYPAYLYKADGSGEPATRPQIVSAPTTPLQLHQNFLVTVGATDTIEKLNLIRLGSVTHSFDSEQRLISLPFTQSGTQITATLDASPNLVPPGYYMLFVLNSSGVPAIAKIVSVAPSYPDLIATSISYSKATGLFTSAIRNGGEISTPTGLPIGVSYSVDGVKCSWGVVSGPAGVAESLTIGSQGGPCTISPGPHMITVLADDVGRITESNKSNNTFSQTITIESQPSADLIPTSISYSNATHLFTATVTNQGNSATPTGVPIGVAYSVDGIKCTWGVVDGPLAAGASVTIGSQGGPCAIDAGTHTIAVIADDANRMQELDKTNNTLAQTITVDTTTVADLVATSLSYSSTDQLFTSTVLNQGNAATPDGVTIGVAYRVDGAQCTWGYVNGPLAAGASVTIGTQGGSCPIPSGTQTITVFADDVNRIPESNESNNQFSQTIELLPDLTPTSLTYSSVTGLFASTILNQGNNATPDGVTVGVAYSVDGVQCTWGYVFGPLAQGASADIGTQGGPCTIGSGTHTITVFADDAGRMFELDKANNTLSKTIQVP